MIYHSLNSYGQRSINPRTARPLLVFNGKCCKCFNLNDTQFAKFMIIHFYRTSSKETFVLILFKMQLDKVNVTPGNKNISKSFCRII